MAADAEYLQQSRAADLEWDRRQRRAEEEISATVAALYEIGYAFSYPCGGFFEYLLDEVERLRRRVQPSRGGQPTIPRRRILPATRKRIFERDAYRCVSCGSWIDLTIDHKIPVVRGGTDDDANLQTMCRSCNTAKGARPE